MGEKRIFESLRVLNIFKLRRNYRFLIFLLSIFSLLICAFLPGWIHVNSPATDLPFSLHSVKEADYTVDQNMPTIPAIGLGIIADVMRDNHVDEDEIEVRVGTLASSLLTPVPLSTGTISVPNTPVPVTPISPLPTFSTTASPAPTVSVPTSYPTAIKPTPIPSTPPIIYPPAPTRIPDVPVPAIALASKVSTYVDNDLSGSITYNDALHYQFIVTNTGETTLSNIHLVDNSFGIPITCPTTTLSRGASMTCTADSPHAVTLPEANAGSVSMISTVLSSYDGKSCTKATTLTTPVTRNPEIQLVKSLASFDDHDTSGSITAADGLWYQFTVTNTGNVSLTNITVTDLTFNLAVTCPVASLAPAASTICSAASAHIITGQESSTGQVSNTATASGKLDSVSYTDSDTLMTIIEPTPLATISGQVREDTDGDGDLLDPDNGIAGVTVYLTNSTNTVTLDTTTTDSGGIFTFNNLLAGSYIVHETDPSGYTSTADSNEPNDNRIPVALAVGETKSSLAFLDKSITSACTAPDPVTGFVVNTIPSDGAIDVPMTTTTITIVFDQPMMTSGGQSIDRVDKYQFSNETNHGLITITGVTYDPVNYTVVLSFNPADSNWQSGCLYEITIKTVQNACGTSQTSVMRTFTTE